jgi:hypothetical protein
VTKENARGKRNRAAIVWSVAALNLAVIGLIVRNDIRDGFFDDSMLSIVTSVFYALSISAFLISGALIVSRQPRNVVGWLLMVPGSLPVVEVVRDWLLGFDGPPADPDLLLWLAVWFDNWSWILLIYPIFHLLLVFPNGKVLSPRWRWVVALEVAMAAFMLFASTFSDTLSVVGDDDVELWSIDNPIGFIPEEFFGDTFGFVWGLGLAFLTVLVAIAFIARFRASRGVARQQLKWPLYAMALFGLVYGTAALGNELVTGSPIDALFGLSLAAIPISVAIAVLRYRLYDLDRIVSRTVTYVVVAALLLGTYGLVVLGLGSFMGSENPLAVAGATLTAAALFNPVRKRMGRWVDRRFNRTRYNAERVIDDFAAALQDRVDPDEVVAGWVDVVSETMHPDAVNAWIRRDASR